MKIINPNNNLPTLEGVISQLKDGYRDFYEILNLPSQKFSDASFEQLMANPNDVLAGVNSVRMLFDIDVFNIFENILLKHHDNGDVKAVFYTTTKNAKAILELFGQLHKHLGTGLYKEEFSSFHQKESVELLARDPSIHGGKDVIHFWILAGDVTILLQYTHVPQQEFSLLINFLGPKQIDYTVRRNGTIANSLKLNIHELFDRDFLNEEKQKDKSPHNTYEYDYRLMQPEFDYFTRVLLTVGAEKPQEGHLWRFNLVLYKNGEPNTRVIRAIAERLIQLYGMDSNGCGELAPHEWDMIDNNVIWTGRTWMFNTIHGLWKDEDGEALSYYVRMDNGGDEYGFKVAIISANEMYELFTAD